MYLCRLSRPILRFHCRLMKKSASYLWLLLFLGTYFADLRGQSNPASADPNLVQRLPSRFIHYTISDGLPSNAIIDLATDSEGFVWIATFLGLARWDGHKITPFNELAVETRLPEAPIKLLYCDTHGYLWVKFLLNPGLYQIDLATFKVTHLQQDFFNSQESFPPSAMEDRSGDVWFATTKGLSKYRWKTRDFEHFPLIFEGRTQITMQVCQTPDDKIWVGTHCGLFLFHPVDKQYEKIPLFENDNHQHLVNCDASGHLWIGRWYDEAHGVLEYDPIKRQVIRIFKKQADQSEGFLSTELSSIFPDGDLIWFGCNEGGLVVWDNKLQQIHRFEPSEADANSLLDWNATCQLKDKYGNYWVGSSSGLQFLPTKDKTAQLLTQIPYQTQCLVYSKTNTAYTLSNGKLVFGTDQGISIFDPTLHRWLNVHLPRYSGNLYNDMVLSVAEHDATSFWTSSWDGLYLLDSRTGAIMKEYLYSDQKTYPGLNTAHQLLQDWEGTLWIGYNEGKLTRLQNNRFEHLNTLSNDGNRLNDRVNCFVEQNRQAMLLGTSDGLFRYDYQQKIYEKIPVTFPGEQSPIKIIGLYLSKQGLLYLIANERVFSLDLATKASAAIPITLPFSVKNCLDLIEDDQGDMWVCTESGLVRFGQQPGEPLFFDARNFLRGNTFYAIWKFKKAAKDKEGRLYFAGISGISVLRPDVLSAKTAPPTAKITALKINNQLAVLDSAINRSTHIRLQAWQNNLTFEFSALGSALSDLNRYAYRMQGDNFWSKKNSEAWVDLGQQTVLNFSNLSPGAYQLQLRVANSDGVWCETPAMLNFTILPPWYRSWLAYGLYVLLIGGGAWAFYRYQLNASLKQAETERLKELDSFKTRFFTNITHEFRTPLTVILGMTEPLKKHFSSRAEASHDKSVEMIRRNGQNLLQLINQILDLAKLESGKLQLNLEKTDLIAYAKYLVESFHSFASGRKIQMHFLPESESIEMDFDREKMQAVLSNLLSNAIKFTPEGGHVYIHIGQIMVNAQPTCQIKVRDTGIGIPEENIGKIFDRFYQVENRVSIRGEGTGIGMALTRELIQLMRGTITVHSKMNVGTTFTITLPIATESQPGHVAAPIPQQIAPKTMPAAVQIPNNPGKPMLLLVEDNEDVREYLIECVSAHYQVVEAHNGQIGIEKALELIPDLIVSDVMMPEKDGFELCQALKNDERTSHIPIVLLTARADASSRMEGLSRGADEYIAKPFDRQELEIRLRNLLENRRRLQARYASLPLPPASEDPELILEDAFLLKIRDVVEAHLSDADFEMPQLERALGMSRSQIFRKVKALTNQSPTLFIRSVRLHKAKELLQSSKLSVAEVAYEVGFTTPSYFSTAFLEEFGKNPSDFR